MGLLSGLFGSSTQKVKVKPWLPNDKQIDVFNFAANSGISPQLYKYLGEADTALGKAQDFTGLPPGLMDFAQKLMGSGPSGVEAPKPVGVNPYLAKAGSEVSGASVNPGLIKAAYGAIKPSYAEGFKETLSSAMDPNARSDAWGQVKQNTIADIMPAINATFSASGMTGSSGHQQQLAKGLSAGLADVENRMYSEGMDRAINAAGMGQDALTTNKSLALQGGQSLQDAGLSTLLARLQGAGALQGQDNENFLQGLQGAQFKQGTINDATTAGLQGAGLLGEAYSNAASGLTDVAKTKMQAGVSYQDLLNNILSNYLATSTAGASKKATEQYNPGLLDIIGAGAQIAGLVGG